MSQKLNIKSFTVYKLFGAKNHTIYFDDNICIIMGINGTYKTTILTMFYYFISGEFDKLLEYEFEEIGINFENNTINITYELLESCKFMNFDDMWSFADTSDISQDELFYILEGDSRKKISDTIDVLYKLYQKLSQLKKAIGAIGIVFLPSYRHMENKLVESSDVHRDRNRNRDRDRDRNRYHNQRFIESIENAYGKDEVTVGMDTISERIKSEILKSELQVVNITTKYSMQLFEQSFSGSVNNVNNSEIKMIANLKEEDFKNSLAIVKGPSSSLQLLENFLSVQTQAKESMKNGYNRTNIRNAQASIKAINSFMFMSQEIQEIRYKIDLFFDMCNKYLEVSHKKLVKENFSENDDKVIRLEDGKDIELKGLSSGEQQILSIFSRVYLFPEKKDLFIIIDEPEMSLSMPWQNNFLPDILQGKSTVGLLVATHSPDIIQKFDKKTIKIIHTDFPLEQVDETDDNE